MRMTQRTRNRASTTPVYDHSSKHRFLRSLTATILAPTALCILIGITGLPGLRIEYTYRGPKHARMDLSCMYLTVEGFRRVTPPFGGINQCGLVEFFPFNPLSLVTGQEARP